MLGLSGPSRAMISHPGATPTALQKSVGARVCLSGWSGSSAALSGGRGGGGGTKFVLPSRSGMAGVPVLTSGERCVLAASELVGGGVLCGGGFKSAPRSGSRIHGVIVPTAGELCVLAASRMMCADGDDDEVRNLTSSSVVRWRGG